MRFFSYLAGDVQSACDYKAYKGLYGPPCANSFHNLGMVYFCITIYARCQTFFARLNLKSADDKKEEIKWDKKVEKKDGEEEEFDINFFAEEEAKRIVESKTGDEKIALV